MLEQNLLNEIEKISKRKIHSFEQYHNAQQISWKRKQRVYGTTIEKKKINRPEHWKKNNMHNPYYVLKHSKEIAHSVFKKLITESYKPREPFIRQIPKKDSSEHRNVNIFQIPDEAVSYLVYSKLLQKNKHRLSSFSYAYRNDRNVHFAIQDIALDMRDTPRIYIAEFDFKDFFGSINHSFIINQYDKNGFMISKFERYIIQQFLEMNINLKDGESYRGIAQGTSISLFLANMVCWELDKSFELNGLRFARYADDTIIWSDSYSNISKAFSLINEFSKKAGVELNLVKSDGISLLTSSDMNSKLASKKESIDFLGYTITNEKISIKEKSEKKIKQQISYILYKNLIQPINSPTWKSVSAPSIDRDEALVSAIMQIRRYLYGNLNEKMLRNYISGSYKRLNFKGIMSFYPLIDDEEQLRKLDKWLVSAISNTLKKRGKLLSKKIPSIGSSKLYSLRGHELLDYCKHIKIGNSTIEIPSFLRIYLAIKEKVVTAGIEDTMHPKSNYYDY